MVCMTLLAAASHFSAFEQSATKSRHAQRTMELGLAGDIALAMQRNTSTAVPMIVERGDGWAALIDLAARPASA